MDTANNNYTAIYHWDDLVTFQDGSLFGGILYEYDYATNTDPKKHDFIDATVSFPERQAIKASNGKLYALNNHGDSGGYGTLFEYIITTSTLSTKIDLDSINSGQVTVMQ